MSLSSKSAFVPRRRHERDAAWSLAATGRRLIFLHIPKTAGTAITSYLRQRFPDSEVMPQLETPFHRSHPIWPLIARRYQLLGVGMHLEHEHVAAFQRGLLDERPPFLLTVLREPRARLLSQYKEWRSTSDEAMRLATDELKDAILTARSQPFSVFLRSENPTIRLTLDNLQTRLLVGRNLSRTCTAEELLNRARHNLAQYDLVGTTCSCDATVATLADAYGWPLPKGGTPRRHVSQLPDATALATSPADEEQIRAFTALDQALWDDLINNRLSLPPASGTAPGSSLPASFCTRLTIGSSQSDTPPKVHLLPNTVATLSERLKESVTHGVYLSRIYDTVDRVVEEYSATSVFDLDRRLRYPMYQDNPRPLGRDERVAFVVRLKSLGYHASSLTLDAARPPASLLVITEVDNDPRLLAWLRQADISRYTTHHGEGDSAVFTARIGELNADYGSQGLTVFIESLMRCQQTHPSVMKTLQDTPVVRRFAQLQLQHALAAVIHMAQQPEDSQSHPDHRWLTALLATLRPEDQDALVGGGSRFCDDVASLSKHLHNTHDDLLARLSPFSKAQLRFTLTVLSSVVEEVETADTTQLVDAYETVFTLLCHLVTKPLSRPSLVRGGRPEFFDFASDLQVFNAHRLEGAGVESYRWLGPQRTSRILIPVQPAIPQQLAVFIAAFIDPEVFKGASYCLNGSPASPVCSITDDCTVATFAISSEAAAEGAVELTITVPFTTSDLDMGRSADPRQKSMALRQIRVTPEVADRHE